MVTAHLILFLLALFCAGLAAFSVPSPPRVAAVHWGWLGFMLFLLASLV